MEDKSIENMEISGNTLKELWIAAKWAKFLAIVTVGLYFLFVFLSIFGGIITALFAIAIPFGGFIQTVITIIIYTLTLLIPGLFLYNFAVNIQKGIVRNQDEFAAKGAKKLRQLFQYSGILCMVTIFIIGTVIVIGVVSSIF